MLVTFIGKCVACVVKVGDNIGSFQINNIEVSNCVGEDVTFGIQFTFVKNIEIHDCDFTMSIINSQLPHTIYSWGGVDEVEIYNVSSKCLKSITSLFRIRTLPEFQSNNGNIYIHDCNFYFENNAGGSGIEIIDKVNIVRIENIEQVNGARLLSCQQAIGNCYINNSSMIVNDVMNTEDAVHGTVRYFAENNADTCQLKVENCSTVINNENASYSIYGSNIEYDNYHLTSKSNEVMYLYVPSGNGKIYNSYLENVLISLYDSSVLEITDTTLINNLSDNSNMMLTGNAEGTLYLSNVTLQGYSSNFPPHVIIKEK